ncbi:cupin domain-containing protein [Cupriavidus plantarum]|uniref:cupin domain-containing protein n=1 Tax=Cupriavidus plantarum TaxID=942865 RepID=UPI000E258A04|nr:AraC family transcriptional regulator [Cupriavidus plantarum]REE93557.1 AraC family transcriptional activator of mtrCDE [Cupriavidus plantarum]
MDWLSKLLDVMRVRGRLEVRCLYGAPWRVNYAQSSPGEMPYHVIVAGSAILEDGHARHSLTAGDIVILSYGSAHALHDGSGRDPLAVRKRDVSNIVVSENRGGAERLDMLCGRFVVDPQHERLVRSYLPPVLIMRGASLAQRVPTDTAARVIGLVSLMRDESTADGLGGMAMLNGLSSALFALVLRLASESETPPVGLLSLAGHSRLAPALMAMFSHPAHPWTLPTLAARCNMSRATLARHFQERIGRSPSDLLTDIRMTMAAGALRESSASTEAIAELVGYQSVAAFRRAFKEHTGLTPGEWRRGEAAKAETFEHAIEATEP